MTDGPSFRLAENPVHLGLGATAIPQVRFRASPAGAVTAASSRGFTTIDEHHVMRLSDPAEFEAAYEQAGLSFERLPDLLRSGRAVYVGLAT